ncbi:MAG: PEP/pyruvate-binding domain-containing protein [Pirellulales bacterium]
MLIVPLSTPLELSECGGKAYHLRCLLEAGWNVPPGWVVTTAAFAQFQSACAAQGIAPQDTPVPATVVAAIREVLAEMPAGGLLAVRSSAVGEDSAQAAFAGQLDTVLAVPPQVEEVVAAVRACWVSYEGPRVRAYQAARGIRLRGMAVIIQRLVPGAVSGVMFTRHPTAAHDPRYADAILVECCTGLGDNLVAGRVTPASRVLWRSSPAAAESLRPVPDHESQAEAVEFPLGAEPLAALAAAADRLESLFGGPQDVEWTWEAEGQLHWLQSRPITTGPAATAAAQANEQPARIRPAEVASSHDAGAVQIWSNANLNENYPEPVTPLLASIAQRSYYYYFRNLGVALSVAPRRIAEMEPQLRFLVGTHAGRLYYNLTNIRAVLAAAPWGDWLAAAFLDFVGTDDGVQPEATGAGARSWWGRVKEWAEVARIVWRAGRWALQLRKGVARFADRVARYATQTHPDRLDALSWDELLTCWRGFAEIRHHRWLEASLADAASMVGYGLLKHWLRREFPERDEASLHNRLLRGLRDVVSVGPAESLWELSRTWHNSPALLAAARQETAASLWARWESDPAWDEVRRGFRRWLDDWGFRCSGELLLTVPSYQEQPVAALELLRTYTLLDGAAPGERLAEQEQQRAAETQQLLGQLARRPCFRWFPWPRRDVVLRRLLQATQTAISCRERARLSQALIYQRLRRLALAIGRRFQQVGWLAAADDIFDLTWDEIESLLAGGSPLCDVAAELVRVRRDLRLAQALVNPPQDLRLPRGVAFDWRTLTVTAPQAAGDGVGIAPGTSRETAHAGQVLRGLGACGGQVTGTACVLEDMSQMERLVPGDILVARQTDPGWATVFPLVRGLVMERGGMLSHGAILAREYGLPTVVGIPLATQYLAGGVRVLVHGDRGEVHLLDQRPPAAQAVPESLDDAREVPT